MKKEKDSNFSDTKISEEYSEYFTIEGLRKKFENCLEIWGLDFNLSQKIWDLYLEYELGNLKEFERKGQIDEINKMEFVIRSIFRRRISFPHIDLDIVWKEYKKWETHEEHLKKCEIKYKEVL